MKNAKRLFRHLSTLLPAALPAILLIIPTFGEAPTRPTHVPPDSFIVPEGMDVTVWATSPMLHNPTNMDIDKDGRIWVAEGRNYRLFRNSKIYPGTVEGDRIVVLTDTDADGTADTSHVFVQEPELVAPLGIAVIDNKIVVSQPPSLIVYTDVDRNAVFNPKIDKRDILLTGFGGRNHDHSLHAVTAGPSGQWYFNTGNAGTHIVEGTDGWTLRVGSVYKGGSPSVTDPGPNQGNQPGLTSDDGHVYVGSVALRMNPDGTGLRPIGHNMRNSYEECVTSFGDVFQNDNDDPPACRTTWLMEYGNLGFASDDGARKWQTERRPGQAAAIAEWRQEDPGTIPAGDVYGSGSPTGICYYENGALGDQYNGLLLSCEAARNVVFGYLPVPEGAGFKLERFDFFRSKRAEEFGEDGAKKADFANMFRPSDVTVGPDGVIYVADWFDQGVGGHRMTDPACAGTIYRIAPKGYKPFVPGIDLATTDSQIAALKSPANNVRNSGFTRLKTAGADAVPAVAKLLADPNPHIRARAIWLLPQLGQRGIDKVAKLLEGPEADPDAQIRVAAFRALRFVNHKPMQFAEKLGHDPSIAVRREVALFLRDKPLDQRKRDLITTLAKQYDGNDRWMLEAIGTAATGQENPIFETLSRELGHNNPLKWSKAFAKLAWRLHPPSTSPAFKRRALDISLPISIRKDALTALGFMPTKEAALAMVHLAEHGPEDTKPIARFWLYNRSSHSWSDFVDHMKGLNKKPNELKADRDYLAPITGPEIVKLKVPDVLKLTGDPVQGKQQIARCTMCHQINGTGIDFGPALDEWGRGQSLEAITTALIHPNAGIAHGFEATEIKTKKGRTIQGFSLFTGGSHILKVMGGGEVTIPRKHIASAKPFEKSLMMSAGQLGLQPQEVADIVAYMKHGDKAPASQAKPSATSKPELASPEELYLDRRTAFKNPNDHPDRPNVLLIGDSISVGYTAYVRRELKGKADVFRIPTNGRNSAWGVANLEKWLAPDSPKWDLIHFNWGLWDLCYRHPKSKTQGRRDKVNGSITETPAGYRANLEKIVARLQQTNAQLIWCATTPVPEGEAGRKLGDDITYNMIAKEIMDANGIAINDLHSHALLKLPETMVQKGDVHFTETGYIHLAEKVANEILAKLPKDRIKTEIK